MLITISKAIKDERHDENLWKLNLWFTLFPIVGFFLTVHCLLALNLLSRSRIRACMRRGLQKSWLVEIIFDSIGILMFYIYDHALLFLRNLNRLT